MSLNVEVEREDDGRWIAESRSFPVFWPTDRVGRMRSTAFRRWRFESSPTGWNMASRIDSAFVGAGRRGLEKLFHVVMFAELSSIHSLADFATFFN